MAELAYRGRLVHATSTSPAKLEYIEDAVLLVADGRVKDMGHADRFAGGGFDLSACVSTHGLMIPGFIDAHVVLRPGVSVNWVGWAAYSAALALFVSSI